MDTMAFAPIPAESPIHIQSRRATCAGIQYIVADALDSHIVTVHADSLACSCNQEPTILPCEHRRLVELQERAYTAEAARRAVYVDVFNLY